MQVVCTRTRATPTLIAVASNQVHTKIERRADPVHSQENHTPAAPDFLRPVATEGALQGFTVTKNYSRCYDVAQEASAKKAAVGENTKVKCWLDPSGKTMFMAEESTAQAKSPGRNKTGKGPKPWSKGKYKSVCNFRIAGMGRLIADRHGGPVDTDDAETYYMAALPHLVARNWAYDRDEDHIMSVKWALIWTPDLVASKGRAWFHEQEQRILAEFDNHDGRPSIPDADDFARELGITHAEVLRHDLRTIGAVDRQKAQRIAQERETDRAYQKAKRIEDGATPREDSITTREPWLAYGIKSRASYYRAIERGEVPADPVMLKRKAKAQPKPPVLRLIRSA